MPYKQLYDKELGLWSAVIAIDAGPGAESAVLGRVEDEILDEYENGTGCYYFDLGRHVSIVSDGRYAFCTVKLNVLWRGESLGIIHILSDDDGTTKIVGGDDSGIYVNAKQPVAKGIRSILLGQTKASADDQADVTFELADDDNVCTGYLILDRMSTKTAILNFRDSGLPNFREVGARLLLGHSDIPVACIFSCVNPDGSCTAIALTGETGPITVRWCRIERKPGHQIWTGTEYAAELLSPDFRIRVLLEYMQGIDPERVEAALDAKNLLYRKGEVDFNNCTPYAANEDNSFFGGAPKYPPLSVPEGAKKIYNNPLFGGYYDGYVTEDRVEYVWAAGNAAKKNVAI